MIGQSECGDLPGCVRPLPLAAAFHHDIRTYRDIYIVYLHIFMNHRNEEQLDKVRNAIHNYIDNGKKWQDLCELVKTFQFPLKYRQFSYNNPTILLQIPTIFLIYSPSSALLAKRIPPGGIISPIMISLM